jgi:hypothetical protein
MNLGMLHPLMQRLKKHHKKIVDVFIVEYDLAPEYPYPRGLKKPISNILEVTATSSSVTNNRTLQNHQKQFQSLF